MSRDNDSSTRTIVYLVVERGWLINERGAEKTADGITHVAFRSRQRAEAYGNRLIETSRISNFEIVEQVLEEADE